jgi:predicted nuclease of predicted toxin-antitoxin system
MFLQYLVNVNLPKISNFQPWKLVHVTDVNPLWKDQEIWNFALENSKVILTKDTDFYNRFISRLSSVDQFSS